MDEETYCRRYPWKAKPCIGCNRNIILKKQENFCNECKLIIKRLPASLANRVRHKKMTCKEAESMYDRINEARRKIDASSCKIEKEEQKNKKSRVEEMEIIGTAKKLKKFTAIEISKKMRISTQTAIKYLNELFDRGMLKREKCGHFILWIFESQI